MPARESPVVKATVFIATSIDGFIARENGDIDWLPGAVEPHGFEELFASVDAVVIGRKTFETVLKFGSWGYGQKPVVVLSSRAAELKAPVQAICDFLNGEPQEVVTQLAHRGFKHVWLDGGLTIQRFLAAGLIQRMIITRIPVLLGSGIPLFGPLPHDVKLQHVSTRSLPSGIVQSEYAALE